MISEAHFSQRTRAVTLARPAPYPPLTPSFKDQAMWPIPRPSSCLHRAIGSISCHLAVTISQLWGWVVIPRTSSSRSQTRSPHPTSRKSLPLLPIRTRTEGLLCPKSLQHRDSAVLPTSFLWLQWGASTLRLKSGSCRPPTPIPSCSECRLKRSPQSSPIKMMTVTWTLQSNSLTEMTSMKREKSRWRRRSATLTLWMAWNSNSYNVRSRCLERWTPGSSPSSTAPNIRPL